MGEEEGTGKGEGGCDAESIELVGMWLAYTPWGSGDTPLRLAGLGLLF